MLTQTNPDITGLNCRHSHPLPNREGILSPAPIDGLRIFCRGEAGGIYTEIGDSHASACFIHGSDGNFSQQVNRHDNHCSVPAGVASGNIEHFLPLVSPRMLRPYRKCPLISLAAWQRRGGFETRIYVRSIRRLNLARCDARLAA